MAKRGRVNGLKIVQVKDLDVQLQTILEDYSAQATAAVDMLSEETVKRIAQETKGTAPKGARRSFKRHITSGVVTKTRYRRVYAWYVKPPDHRVTHLLVKGHATRDGGRTAGNPFLHNAVGNATEWFEERLQNVMRNAAKGGKSG